MHDIVGGGTLNPNSLTPHRGHNMPWRRGGVTTVLLRLKIRAGHMGKITIFFFFLARSPASQYLFSVTFYI